MKYKSINALISRTTSPTFRAYWKETPRRITCLSNAIAVAFAATGCLVFNGQQQAGGCSAYLEDGV